MSLKWVGAMLIIAGCGAVGFSMAAAYRKEETALRQLVAALDYMGCELQYRLTPLPDLCRQAGGQCSGVVGTLLTRLAEELESQISPDVQSCVAASLLISPELPKRTKDAVLLMGASLGRFDADGQIKGLETVRSHCRRELDELSQNRDSRLRGYQTLGLCAGAALAILFV